MSERVFLLPDPGEGLEEAEVVAWLVAEGDAVELNQPFVEVETAKATVEIPSPYEGTVSRLHAAEGETVRVGSPLVTFSVPGAAEEPGPAAAEAPGARPPGAPRAPAVATDGVRATPAVRALARDLGVDLERVSGTGPEGRVTEDDVRRAAGPPPHEGGTGEHQERVPITSVRRAIAARLTASAAIPQVTTFRTLDASALERVRAELDLSPLPIAVVALADTIREHPLLNARWTEEAIVVPRSVHVGIAVDTDRGLVVPVVRDVVGRRAAEIADEIRRLAGAARDGSLAPTDVGGSTISVSNTGSYGSEAGTPLLNPGNAVTIALGVIASRALVVDGAVVARPACTLSMTFDHRLLDGATAGRALTALVGRLHDATRLRDLVR
jgi:pyruvate dehydrogenase E2 component (dihydrolipoamide acetyltransferase)